MQNRNSINKIIARELRSGNYPTNRQVLKTLRQAEKHVARAAELLQDITMFEDNAWRESEALLDYLQTRILELEEKITLGVKR